MNDPKPESFKPSTVAEEYQKELDTLKAENQALKEQLDTANNQLEEVRADRQQLQSQLDRTLAELAQLKENPPPAAEQNPTPAIDLSDKAGKIASFLKTLLATDTKLIKDIKQAKDIRLPKDTISKIEEILGGGDG